MPRAFTQKDIARRLGVTVATVSLALRNDPRISLETRSRVQAIAKELGYRPNPVVAALAASRWKSDRQQNREVIAFVSSARGSLPGLEKALSDHAESVGYRLERVDASEYDSDRRLNQLLRARGIRGVILEQSGRLEQPHELEWADFVVVQCGLLQKTEVLSMVHLDHYRAVNEAFDHARRAGFKRVAFALPGEFESDRRLQQAALGLQIQERRRAAHVHSIYREPEALLAAAWTPYLDQAFHSNRPPPDCIIATGHWAILRIKEQLPKERMPPFATLFTQLKTTRHSGFQLAQPLMARASIHLLHQRLVDNDFGIPEIRQTIGILPEWQSTPDFRPRE